MQIIRCALLLLAAGFCAACRSEPSSQPQNPELPQGSSATQPAPPPDSAAVAAQNNFFAYRLLTTLDPGCANTAISPYSASRALAAVTVGANSYTRQSLLQALCAAHANVTPEEIAGFNRFIAQPAMSPISQRLTIWTSHAFPLRPQYTAAMQNWFDASVKPLDFSNPRQPAQTINAWPNTGAAPSLANNRQPMMIVAGVVALEAQWETPFHAANTKDAPFHLIDAKTVTVPMMHNIVVSPRYLEADAFRALDLPFKHDTNLCMRIVLPDENAVASILAQAAQGRLTAKLDKLWSNPKRATYVNVCLPRFKIASQHELTGTIQKLRGPHDPQSDDFSRAFATPQPAELASVRQTCIIDISEQGIKASAEDEEDLYPGLLDRYEKRPPAFRVDRPFYFEVIHVPTRTILFMGIVADPTQLQPATPAMSPS